jgi:hypothetical protein
MASRARSALIALALVCGLGSAAALGLVRGSGDGHAEPNDSRGASRTLTTLPLSLQAAVSATLGAEDGHFAISRGRGRVPVATGGGFTTRFGRRGPTLSIDGLATTVILRAVGSDQMGRARNPGSETIAANHLSYRHAGVTEWYRNGPAGLEQGFTIARPPVSGGASLVLTEGMNGGLVPRLSGRAVLLLKGAHGPVVLRYGGLSAHDSAGHALPAHLDLDGSSVRLRVNVTDAQYPVTVDPLFQVAELTTGDAGSATGDSVALSDDGSTALVGGPLDGAGQEGAAWVFVRTGSTWSQQGPKLVGGTSPESDGDFGASVALSGDGNTALIGAPGDGQTSDGSWVFTRSGSTWSQQGGELMPSDEAAGGPSRFGAAVALSSDGTTAVIGGADDNAGAGAVWVFSRASGAWAQEGSKLTADPQAGIGELGASVAISPDGSTLLAGGPAGLGAALVFVPAAQTWTQQGPPLSPDPSDGSEAHFGSSASLSSDGNSALIGESGRTDAACGCDQGAAWVFDRSNGSWSGTGAALVPSDIGVAALGTSVALSGDGTTAVVSGSGQSDQQSGAWLFTNSGTGWIQQGSRVTIAGGSAVSSTAISGDGATTLLGSADASGGQGAAFVYGLDSAPPDPFALISPNDGAANIAPNQSFSWDQTTDSGSGVDHYELWLDGTEIATVPATSCSNEICTTAISGLSDGSHIWFVKAVDEAGNPTSSSTRSFTVDATPPDAFSNVSPADGARVGNATPTISWTASSDSGSGLAGYRVLIDGVQSGAALPATATSYTVPGHLIDGRHTWRIQAFDNAGNVRVGAQWIIYVDTEPPNARLSANASNPLTGATVAFDAYPSTDPEGADIVSYAFDPLGTGAFTAPQSSPKFSYAYSRAGGYRAFVRVTNSVGISSTAEVTVAVHPAPPPGPVGVSIDSGAIFTDDPEITLSVVWPAGADTVTVSNDGGFAGAETFPAASSIPWTLDSASAERLPKTVYVRFGFDTQNYTDDIILDTVAPAVTAASTTGGPGAYQVAVAASDDNSGVGKVQVTGDTAHPGALQRYVSTVTYTGAAAPQWVRVQDNAGNLSAWHAIASAAAPATPVVVPANGRLGPVAGLPVVGGLLTAANGSWSGTLPLSFGYQWQRCQPGCVSIGGAGASGYIPAAGDLGAKLRVLVTASNAAGSAQAASAEVGPVLPAGAQVRAALAKAAAATGPSARITRLLTNHGDTYTVKAPSAGTLTVSWYAPAHTAHASTVARRLLVAFGGVRYPSAGGRKLTLKLTSTGRRLLSGVKRSVKLDVVAAFTPSGGARAKRTKTITLRR